ncbi:MAG: hypothetical protein RSE58_02990 [Clostridia bacterium]
MPNKPNEKCYPAGTNQPLMFVGYALIALGVILLFACIPCWAWLALLGVGLMAVGVVLLRFSKAWR